MNWKFRENWVNWSPIERGAEEREGESFCEAVSRQELNFLKRTNRKPDGAHATADERYDTHNHSVSCRQSWEWLICACLLRSFVLLRCLLSDKHNVVMGWKSTHRNSTLYLVCDVRMLMRTVRIWPHKHRFSLSFVLNHRPMQYTNNIWRANKILKYRRL